LGRIARWMLLLQEYDFEIIHKPSRQHVMANHLSRVTIGQSAIRVKDQFPDTNLFMVQVTPKNIQRPINIDRREPLMYYF